MAIYVSPSQAARMIDGFMLGAVMQQDPLLDEFGNMPDEPTDDDPAWDMPDADESGGNPSLEQGMLFDMPRQEKRKSKPHPQKRVMQTDTLSVKRSEEFPPPYLPRHFELTEYLPWFCGDYALAAYWHGKQNMEKMA